MVGHGKTEMEIIVIRGMGRGMVKVWMGGGLVCIFGFLGKVWSDKKAFYNTRSLLFTHDYGFMVSRAYEKAEEVGMGGQFVS